jgi:hypothetical protein
LGKEELYLDRQKEFMRGKTWNEGPQICWDYCQEFYPTDVGATYYDKYGSCCCSATCDCMEEVGEERHQEDDNDAEASSWVLTALSVGE